MIYKQKNRTVGSLEELVRSFFELVERKAPPAGIAVLPYIKGLTEPLSRTLQNHDIKVYNKPVKTLERQFPTAKQKPPIEEQKNVIYQIPCQDCSWSYIGETGRSLKTRKSEHIRNVKLSKKGSNVAKHAWTQDHIIDFANAKVIDKGNYKNLKTLESWHTAITDEADNNSNTLPAQYAIL